MISHQTIMLDSPPPNDPNPTPATQRVPAADSTTVGPAPPSAGTTPAAPHFRVFRVSR
jgi:hypothetical protein